MTPTPVDDRWDRGSPYERYIGRWSRRIAPLFLDWLAAPPGVRWLDVGCGTGALCAAISEHCAPGSLFGVEPSDGFRALAARNLEVPRAQLLTGDACNLPLPGAGCDLVVSALVLNFVPDLPVALGEMRRVSRPGATIAAYVWDYAGGMEVIRLFWEAAAALDPAAAALDEGTRFPLCTEAALRTAFEDAGLAEVETAALDLDATFADFEDYWAPFLGGQGPAPAYVAALAPGRRDASAESLRTSLPRGADGGITLRARALAIRGRT